MSLENLLQYTVFSIGGQDIGLEVIILASLIILSILVIQRVVLGRVLPNLIQSQEVSKIQLTKLRRQFNLTLLILLILGLWYSTGIDIPIKEFNEVVSAPVESGEEGEATETVGTIIRLTITNILASFFIWHLAMLVLVIFDTVPIEHYLVRKKPELSKRPIPEKVKEEEQQRARRNFRNFIKTLAILLIITILGVDFKLYDLSISDHSFSIRVSNVISAILVFLLARILIWLVIRIFLTRIYSSQKIDSGSQFAINQLFQYIVYFIALLSILNVLGMNPNVLAGSAAALLLGISLGLQQTFNDFFSGVLLLFERTVEVGDVVNVGGLVGTVRVIGLRTSQVQTLDNLTVIVPNSKLVTNTVTNWSHTDYLARFSVKVGVAYGTDTELVKDLLLMVANGHDKVLNFPVPFVRFTSFSESALDFELFFWSSDLVPIENIKSDIRFAIDKAFRENSVEIPFPQRDINLKNMRLPQTKDSEII